MNDLERQIDVSNIVDKGVKRRAFVKSSVAGVVITSLPAKSVWGACNASGISGGSQTTTSCEMPDLSGGRSPDCWGKFVDRDVTKSSHRNMLKEMFTAYSGASNNVVKLKCKDLKSYIENIPEVKLENKVSLNVCEALKGNGDIANLASCYLNAVFGFYSLPLQFSDASELVEHIYGVVQYGGGTAGFGAAKMAYSAPSQNFGSVLGPSFTDGSTNMAIPG